MTLLLESLDPSVRFASFRAVSGDAGEVREDFARMAEVAAGLGYRDLLLHFAKSAGGITQLEAYVGPERRSRRRGCLGDAKFPGDASPSAVATLPTLGLSSRLEENHPLYELSLEASAQSLGLLDEALHLILATWGEESDALLELRTALFEIGSHLLDHSEMLRSVPGSAHAHELQLVVGFHDDGIQGWLRDDGPPYDPSSENGVHLHSETIAQRFAAGEATGWFCRLLDEYEHVHENDGNRIGFHKKVMR